MLEKYRFSVPENKRIRVIIDTDAACEADDQYAIAHALLTPKFDIKGIIAEQFYNAGGADSADRSFAEINRILELMERKDIPVLKGAVKPLKSEKEIPDSDGAEFIVKEALSESSRPLFLLCQGAITNTAAAFNIAPEIKNKLTCIWIGGAPYPNGGWEFNLMNDYHAANTVFNSGTELWQVPMNCYSQMKVSYSELQEKVMPYGDIGRYLFDELWQLGLNTEWTHGESWILGDSPVVGLALDPDCGRYKVRNAPVVNSKGRYIGENEQHIRVYSEIDSRFILEDLFAKLRIVYG